MTMRKFATTFAIAVGGLALAAGTIATAQDTKKLTGSIKIDGSSTVAPITTAVAEEFREVSPSVRVTVGISGTGGGFKRFATGDIDISDASRPIKKEEADQAKTSNVEFIEIPVAFDGLSIVVNYKNDWCNTLTVEDLKKIFLADSKVKTWKDIRPEWPDLAIKLFAPGTDSGTFDYFKEVIAGKEGAIRSDMSVSEDDNVLVRGVEGDEGALGFFGFAYYIENKSQLKAVKIDGGKGPIEPTAKTIEDGTYAPFGRPLFIYVNKTAAARPEVKAFVEFYLKEGSRLAEEVGYVKLPQSITDKAKANFAKLRTGTQYLNDKGEKVSGPLSKVYN
jgi:phosphate transport system substrate-binding protein